MAKALAKDGQDLPEASASPMQQFVTFYLGEECFAFPMAMVREIIRLPAMVRVPLTPDGFEGLANLRGAILPVLDLRRSIGLAPRVPDDASRTIVVEAGRPVGLIVDRVARVVSFASDRIVPQEIGAEAVLAGVIKDSAGLIQILDAGKAIALASLTARKKADRAATTAEREAAAEDSSTVQLVNLVIEEQEYALDIAQVDEIVRPPEAIFHLPQVASHVLGMIDLRDRLLPIVSLRRMFGLPDLAVAETHRILVARTGAGARVGIVVDQVREVLHVPAADIVPVSGLINRSGMQRIGAMCRLEEGKRLVGVLNTATLFDDAEITGALGEVGTPQSEDEVAAKSDETQLVVYQLGGQEYGLDIAAVREIIRVPADLKRVPHAPAYVAGVINVRGAVLPVVNMGARFGLEPGAVTDRERVIVLSRDGVQTGFIVDSVTEVLRIARASLEPAPDISEAQRHLIGTVANLEDGARIIQIVDASALFATPE